jgi:hypothetical protein|tara:strand:+ start:2705 stop:2968 length:264 start_codon:yes stop_codon:yes gene_type:complete
MYNRAKYFMVCTLIGDKSMNFEEFLQNFRSDDLSFALKSLELPTTGNKPDRVSRLVDLEKNGTEIKQILRAFRLEDVRRAAKAVDLI